ncbi:MAG: nucleoside hydrolase [Halieaceae bacterium]|jgi:pyrimidine-specific ribonucleoside hydrolase|nr:nucleoside hydrolase [Halieaceae bacterium]
MQLPMQIPKTLLLCAALLLSQATSAGKPIIYDTDMAIDDWLAMLYLAKHPDVDIVAVTISASGESHCRPGLDNVRNLLKLAGHEQVPVACGDDYPLDGFFVFPEPWQVDSDTLSGIDLGRWVDEPVKGTQSNGHAAELIHQVVNTSVEPVTLVAVGPLTNVAQWLGRYPDDRARVAELVMMGGSYQAPGNIIVPLFTKDHPNTVSEWNFFIDPVATRETLEAEGLERVMVGLDVTNRVRLTHAFADDFKARTRGPAAEFVDGVFDKNRWFIDSNEYYFWDVMAAVVTARPELCQGDAIALSAVDSPSGEPPYLGTSDLDMPATTVRGAPRRHLDAATAGQVVRADQGPVTKVCTATDAEAVFAGFTATLTQQ